MHDCGICGACSQTITLKLHVCVYSRVPLWILAAKPWASHHTEFKLEALCNNVDSKTFLRADSGLNKCWHCYNFQVVPVCSQAQAFYERELEAMKRTQQLTADNLLAWKRTEAELRREFQTQEAALQKTLGKLRAELAKVTDEARENRDKSHKLQASLTAAENNIKVRAQVLSCNVWRKGLKMFALQFMLQKWE